MQEQARLSIVETLKYFGEGGPRTSLEQQAGRMARVYQASVRFCNEYTRMCAALEQRE